VPRPRSAMRKIREILRLALGEGFSRRKVGVATGTPYTTVADHLARAREAGLGWPLPEGMDDAALEARLFARPEAPPALGRPLPDWPTVHRELRRKGVTLQLLWMEHKAEHPDGYQYTQFCRRFREWQGRLDLVMRQEHRAGERLFVDFAGQTIPITDPDTGEAWQAQLFVAVLGASSYTYAEAVASQALPDWIAAHVHALEAMGGCPRIVVPDNLRAGVARAHRYEPDLNRTYEEMAAHYGCAVMPARAGRPRDKAKAENGVLQATRWVLAALRHRTFFSLAEANAAIAERAAWLNARPFKKLPGSRLSLFEGLDRPALRPLPATRYEHAEWRTAKVSIDHRGRRCVRSRRAGSSARSATSASRPASWRSSTRADGWPAIPARPESGRSPRSRRTCPRPTVGTRSGRRAGSSRGRSGPALRPLASSPRSWPRGPTPSTASARAWGSCAWGAATATTVSRPPPRGPWPSGRTATAASSRS
jgi:transposase